MTSMQFVLISMINKTTDCNNNEQAVEILDDSLFIHDIFYRFA